METIQHVMLGTLNPAKIQGVAEALHCLHDILTVPSLDAEADWTCAVRSGVADEPRGFPITIEGAQNRAGHAYRTLLQRIGPLSAGVVAVGIGVESGFIDVAPNTFTLFNFDVCALYNGRQFYLGISPGFEYPRQLMENIFLHRQAFQEARSYITVEADIERRTGLVGVLAGGLTDRPEMTSIATRLALIRYLRRRDYANWQ